MDKISVFTCSARQLKWMRVALIVVVCFLFYEDIIYPSIARGSNNVVVMALYPIVHSDVMRILVNVVNLAGVCFLFEMLRRALLPSNKMAGALVLTLIALKVLIAADNIASIFVIDDDVEFMVYHQDLIHLMQGIQAGLGLAVFIIVLWLCMILMTHYAGRIRDLSTAWLTGVFGPVIVNLFFGVLVEGAHFLPGGVMSYVFAAIMFICACLAPVYIYRCFKAE